MRIRQYAYFAIRSEDLAPTEITERIGVDPDRVPLRGSRLQGPSRPTAHIWEVRCEEPSLTVTEQIADVLARVGPKRSAIRALVESSDEVSARLQVVRFFGADDGEEELPTVLGNLEKLPGQHQLLGWHLSRDVLDFLRDVHAEVDVDEYG